MHRRVLRRRPRYTYSAAGPKRNRSSAPKAAVLLLAAFIILFTSCAAIYLKDISAMIAVSDASDVVTVSVQDAISRIMNDSDYSGDHFVTFQKNSEGEVTAISSNMARINALSAQILDEVVGATNGSPITVEIPVGNLTGISLLMGRGPKVPVKIVTLTSSRVEFNNSVVTAGINQTKHQINLEVIVDIDILVPWGSENTQVITEVLIADTVIVGHVPDTYLNLDGTGE